VLATLVSAKAYWYLTRSTGVVALSLLTLSVVLGVTQVTRWSSPRLPRFVTVGLHRNVSLLVVAFLGVHIASAVVDSFAPIGWLDAVVPFRSAYRALWLGLGAVAFDLVVALTVTSLVRARLGYRAWRAVHWLAYACWPIALLHGLGTGSDAHGRSFLFVDAACIAAVGAAVVWRVVTTPTASSRARAGALAGLTVVSSAIVGWTLLGPLQPGWARRAGTPAALLGSARPANATDSSAAAPADPPETAASTLSVPFTARLDGTVRETGPDVAGRSTVVIDGTLHDGAIGRVHVALAGPALAGGGIEMEQSRAYLGPARVPSLYAGTISALDGNRLVASLRTAGGRHADLLLDLTISGSGTKVTGRARAVTNRSED
jgi:hypothetical protein